jgi:hypothetical protein
MIGALSLLVSCGHMMPLQPKFPQAPVEMMKKAPPLNLVGSSEYSPTESNEKEVTLKLSEYQVIVDKNYNLYHQLASQLNSLQEWIEKERELYNK